MDIQREKWKAALGGARPRAELRNEADLRTMRQGQVAAMHLVDDPHWAAFQRILSGRGEIVRDLRLAALERLANPALKPDEVWAARLEVHQWTTEAAVLESVLAIPGQLIRDGQTAEKVLERFRAPEG